MNTMFFLTTTKIARNLVPIGRFGIRTVQETPLYHNFGILGVVGAAGLFLTGNFEPILGVYTEYKTFKFTFNKFYRHVLLGERSWFVEEKKATQVDGEYGFSDNLLGNEDNFPKSAPSKFLGTLKRDWSPYYQGPYGENKPQEEKKK